VYVGGQVEDVSFSLLQFDFLSFSIASRGAATSVRKESVAETVANLAHGPWLQFYIRITRESSERPLE